jgi:putative restriction endonuclease
MKEGQKLWTRDELILTINLYCELPFGKLHSRNPKIIEFANLLDRTPNSLALKLVNFSSLDSSLQARGIKGMGNASKLDAEIWNEFYNNWDEAFIQSEKLRAKKEKTTIEHLNKIDASDLLKEGKEKERIIKARVNQAIFRKIILATYNSTCCITGINNPELLIASHIVPWSKDEKNRLKPTNGLCLNALHDRAFDKGLITISAKDYTIKISSRFKRKDSIKSIDYNFLRLEGVKINLPDKFLPAQEQLKIHNDFFIP